MNDSTQSLFRFGISFFLLIATLTGCRGKDSSRPEGHYEGTLLQRSGLQISETPVTFEVNYGRDQTGSLTVSDLSAQEFLKADFSEITADHFLLSLSNGLVQAAMLKKEEKHCFGQSALDSEIHFCGDSGTLTLTIENAEHQGTLTLGGKHFQDQRTIHLEDPVSLSWSQAIEIARSKTIASRMEFERLIQAKRSAQSAALSIIPHLNFATALTLHSGGIPLTFLGVLNSIGDLAPFLLPTRWLQAQTTKLNAEAESQNLRIMQADLVNQVEGLGFALKRDQEVERSYAKLIERAKSARDSVQALERDRSMPVGSTDTMQTILDSMALDHTSIQTLVASDREAISQALGFHNPKAVEDLIPSPVTGPIDQTAPLLDSGAIGRLAISRSLELQQMNLLIRSARELNSGLLFSWLDPAGDPGMELGFGLGSVLEIGGSQARSLELQRDQQEAVILQRVTKSLNSFNLAVQALPLARDSLRLQETRLSRILALIGPNTGLSPLDVEAVFQDYLSNVFRFQGLMTQYRVSRSNLDRLLLQGSYADLVPNGSY